MIDLTDILRGRGRGITVREWHEIEREITVATVPADWLVADRQRGLTYGDLIREATEITALPPRPSIWNPDPVRRHPRPNPLDPDGAEVLVVDGHLSDKQGRDTVIVRAYRTQLEDTAERWCARYGYTIHRASWSQLPPVHPTVTVPFRLECWLAPRTDPPWPELRRALAEDAEDREAAAALSGGAMDPDTGDGPYVRHIDVPAPPERPSASPSPRRVE